MMQILDGRKSFYQWDLNQRITSTKFKVGDEVHFHNIKQPQALVVMAYELGGKVVVDVPNILFESASPIKAYIYITEGTSAQTVYEHIFNVEQRAKPSDYVYTETELYTITTAVNQRLAEALATGEFNGEDGKDGQDGKDGKNGVDGKNGLDGKDGEDGYTPVKGVDYWTDADKKEITADVDEIIGETLDEVIEIQESFINGTATIINAEAKIENGVLVLG